MKIFFINCTKTNTRHFVPINNLYVKIYLCGPTTYSKIHLGNAASSIFFDIVKRSFSCYYPIYLSRNITDISTKIILSSRYSSEHPLNLISRMSQYFDLDSTVLNCLKPEFCINVASCAPNIVKNIHAILNNEKLFRRNITSKKFKVLLFRKNQLLRKIFYFRSFVIWKMVTLNNFLYVNSLWGRGTPGWHIECSYISRITLGNRIDIHGGGGDLIFPHHENELLQNKTRESVTFIKYWIHNKLTNVNGKKMSKSYSNNINIKDLVLYKVDFLSLRYFFSLKITANNNITWENINICQRYLEYDNYLILKDYVTGEKRYYNMSRNVRIRTSTSYKKYYNALFKYCQLVGTML